LTKPTQPATSPRSRPARASLLLLAALLLLAGCATGSPGHLTEEERVDRATELATRPPSDEAVARYEQMLQRIRDQLDTELGPYAWHPFHDQERGTCGSDFPMPSQVVRLQSWGFDSPIADWPTATRIVTTIATEYGFTAPEATIDKPAENSQQHDLHRLVGTDPDLGADYQFTTNVNTIIGITTGCHPSAPAQSR
jgi:hypothetical protein